MLPPLRCTVYFVSVVSLCVQARNDLIVLDYCIACDNIKYLLQTAELNDAIKLTTLNVVQQLEKVKSAKEILEGGKMIR